MFGWTMKLYDRKCVLPLVMNLSVIWVKLYMVGL